MPSYDFSNVVFYIFPSSIRYLIYITFTVNLKGILAKTIDNKKYFIPREKIDYCFSKKVKRYKYKSSDEAKIFYCVFIKLNEIPDEPIKFNQDILSSFNNVLSGKIFSNFNKVCITVSEVDTGLCYESKMPAKYLANEFNKYLGIEFVEEEEVKEKDTDKKSKKKTKDTDKKSKKKIKDTEEKTVKEKDIDKKSKKKIKDKKSKVKVEN